MRNYWYTVRFSTGKVECVWAGDLSTATILAQAKQIEKGNDYIVVVNVKRIKD